MVRYGTSDPLLDEMWQEQSRPNLSVEQALLLAVLEDGIKCAIMTAAVKSEREIEDARRWIESNSSERFSFQYTCDHLGINASALRKKIMAHPGYKQEPRISRKKKT